MKKPTGSVNRKMHPLIPALAALGTACGLAALPASALELGDINVQSTLGQPLRASIAYALGPNEQLYDFCIYLRPSESFDGVPSVTRARVSLTNGTIVLTGNVAVRDPLLNLRLSVDCPYSPNLQREYLLMLDPGVAPRESRAVPVAAETVQRVAATETVATRSEQPVARPVTRPRAEATPLTTDSTYVVQTGDTVSAIAARVEDRTIGLWPSVNAIVAANPGAFIDGDVNRLKAGSTLVIPALDGAPVVQQTEPASAAAEPLPMDEAPPAEAASQTPQTVTGEPGEIAASAPASTPEVSRSIPGMTIVGNEADAADQAAEPAMADIAQSDIDEPRESTATAATELDGSAAAIESVDGLMNTLDTVDDAAANTDDLKPGDVILPTAAPAAVSETATRDVPVVAPAVQRPVDGEGGWSWLLWAGGGVLVLLGAFFAFGRSLRDRFSPAPATSPRRTVVTADEDAEPTLENRAIEDLDFNFDDPVLANAMSLDADFSDGSGLGGDEVDVMQDFGFSAEHSTSSSLDHEISADFSREPASAPTDVIPPSHRIEESSILESEVSGDELTGDYDLSMIVDATRQSIGDYDRTAQDLQAVRVYDDEYTVEDNTLSREVDMTVLERDYEDELSATQALNMEIEKAASELADRLEKEELPGVTSGGETTIESPFGDMTVEMPPDDATREMPDAYDSYELTAADKTMEMPMSGDNDMTAELTANLPTDLDALNDPSADSGTQRTVEMAAAGSDITVELQIESGKVDTKKK